MRIGILIHGMETVGFECYRNHLMFLATVPREHKYSLITVNNTRIVEARNCLVSLALEDNCDKLLFLDTDHILPANMLERLLGCDGDVVSGLICRRRPPFDQVGYLKPEGGDFQRVLIPLASGVYDVDCCAFGCTLVDRGVFDVISKPFFRDEKYRSDMTFCLEARSKGKRVQINSDVMCGHVIAERAVVYPWNSHKISAKYPTLCDSSAGWACGKKPLSLETEDGLSIPKRAGSATADTEEAARPVA